VRRPSRRGLRVTKKGLRHHRRDFAGHDVRIIPLEGPVVVDRSFSRFFQNLGEAPVAVGGGGVRAVVIGVIAPDGDHPLALQFGRNAGDHRPAPRQADRYPLFAKAAGDLAVLDPQRFVDRLERNGFSPFEVVRRIGRIMPTDRQAIFLPGEWRCRPAAAPVSGCGPVGEPTHRASFSRKSKGKRSGSPPKV
jgi:hypothetical protein